MTESPIRCERCGRMNPANARACLDCNALLQRNLDAATPVGAREAAQRRREIDKSSGFDQIAQFYQDTATDPGEPAEPGTLSEIERFDRDETRVDDVGLPGIERLGGDAPAEEGGADLIERSRAYEVEATPIVPEEADEPVAFAVDLESFEDANQRMSAVAGEFQKGGAAHERAPAPPPGVEPRPQPIVPPSRKTPPAPRHKSPWERSDVEIMTSIRRRAVARGLMGTSLPLIAIGLAIILAGRLFVAPWFLPSGTWGGTMVDRTGDSGLVPFTLDLSRSGEELTGRFWLARAPGEPFEEAKGRRVPYVLEGVYRNAPLVVAGRFTRKGLTLALSRADDPGAPSLSWEGTFTATGRAEGKLVSTRGTRATWSMTRTSVF